MNTISEIVLQSMYDEKMLIRVDIGRNSKPLFLGRGPATRICDTKCSRKQLKISRAKRDSKKFSEWKTEPITFEIQPMSRNCMIHRAQADRLEDVKRDTTVTLQIGDSFSVFDSFFWFTICDRNALVPESHAIQAKGRDKKNNTNNTNNNNNSGNNFVNRIENPANPTIPSKKLISSSKKNARVNTLQKTRNPNISEESGEVESMDEDVEVKPKPNKRAKKLAGKARIAKKKMDLSDEEESEDTADFDYNGGYGDSEEEAEGEEEEEIDVHRPDPIKRVNQSPYAQPQLYKRTRGNSASNSVAEVKKKRY